MESFILDVLGLVLRWLHLITGIAWVGASFYFIWLDNSLESPPKWKQEKGIKGDLWSFHGGGIYEVAKYKAGPEKMPKTLHWFYWEAYSTWITGMCLMFVVYYFQAPSFLVKPDGWINEPLLAVFASLGFISGGVLCYEILLRSRLSSNFLVFALAMLAVLSVFSWLSSHLFAARAAYLHMGALVGTIMAANVFIGIIPPQRAFVRSVEDGTEAPIAALENAKMRSTHNNYFTLPVLFCMISNHYPVFYGHEFAWLILIAIFTITAIARQYFNLAHKGVKKPEILVICALCFIALCAWLGWDNYSKNLALAETQVDVQQAMAVGEKHCAQCHAPNPSFPGFTAPPLGMNFVTQEDYILNAEKALVAVSTDYMPLGNITAMTAEERELLLAWLSQI